MKNGYLAFLACLTSVALQLPVHGGTVGFETIDGSQGNVNVGEQIEFGAAINGFYYVDVLVPDLSVYAIAISSPNPTLPFVEERSGWSAEGLTAAQWDGGDFSTFGTAASFFGTDGFINLYYDVDFTPGFSLGGESPPPPGPVTNPIDEDSDLDEPSEWITDDSQLRFLGDAGTEFVAFGQFGTIVDTSLTRPGPNPVPDTGSTLAIFALALSFLGGARMLRKTK